MQCLPSADFGASSCYVWAACAHINKSVHRWREVPVGAEDDDVQMTPVVFRWSQLAKGTACKEVMVISEAPQSINHSTSDCFWAAGVAFIAASDRASSTYAGLLSVFSMQWTGKGSRIHHSHFTWAWQAGLRATQPQLTETRAASGCCSTFHTALQCHLQTERGIPGTPTRKSPSHLQSQTAAYGDAEWKTQPSLSYKLNFAPLHKKGKERQKKTKGSGPLQC